MSNVMRLLYYRMVLYSVCYPVIVLFYLPSPDPVIPPSIDFVPDISLDRPGRMNHLYNTVQFGCSRRL